VAGLAASSSSVAQTAQPKWDAVPTVADAFAVFPPEALAEHYGGEAVLTCRHDKLGILHDCQVLEGLADGGGFGAAALSLAPKYRLNVRSTAMEQPSIRVPMFFPAQGSDAHPLRTAVFRPSTGRFAGIAPAGPYWPDLALRLGLGGSAQVDCKVAATGRLADCRLINQTPIEAGFGDVVMKMASVGWMTAGPKPDSAEEPVDGYWRFDVEFPRRTLADAR
jgi:hypothetical protein